jgi:hypothetical protein
MRPSKLNHPAPSGATTCVMTGPTLNGGTWSGTYQPDVTNTELLAAAGYRRPTTREFRSAPAPRRQIPSTGARPRQASSRRRRSTTRAGPSSSSSDEDGSDLAGPSPGWSGVSEVDRLDPRMVVHGVADHFLGRPFDCCPYDRRVWPAAWHAWRQGWLWGSLHEHIRGEYERSRWLLRRAA